MNEQNRVNKTEKNDVQPKKPYEAPVLTIHGTIHSITQGAFGGAQDAPAGGGTSA